MDAPTLASAMGCKLTTAQAYISYYNEALIAAKCTTVNRSAMFAAQVGHESVGLQYMEEIADGTAYNNRTDLGNTQPGDGPRFKGRGWIQLTGRNNYGLFGQWAHANGYVSDPAYFVNNPTVVATGRWVALSASWYWVVARPLLNQYCDAGDVTAATKAINGGTNGLADRLARWNHCLTLGTRLLPTTTTSAGQQYLLF